MTPMADDPRNLPVLVVPQRAWRGRKVSPPYSLVIAEEICERHGSGETLLSIVKDQHMPSWWILHQWEHDLPEFNDLLARARQLHVECMRAEVTEIADNVNLREVREYTYEVKGAKVKVSAVDQVERDKLRVYVRQKAIDAYINHPGRKDDPPGGEQPLAGLSVTINNGWDTDD